jgi:hypothetical protein
VVSSFRRPRAVKRGPSRDRPLRNRSRRIQIG